MDQTARKETRGNGLLEPMLARMRAHKANSLIPLHLRSGRVLDIGCGSYPYFLAHTAFLEKFAVDQSPPARDVASTLHITYHSINLNSSPALPFNTGYFNVITLLAVIEHLDPQSMVPLFNEIYRTLSQGGVVIMTSPAPWSNSILKIFANLHLVSREEIQEHTCIYTLPLIGWYFGKAGFDKSEIRFGYFEFFLNMWAMAVKGSP